MNDEVIELPPNGYILHTENHNCIKNWKSTLGFFCIMIILLLFIIFSPYLKGN